MATGRVRAGFFHIRARPAGQDLRPRPGPFTKRIFFPGPEPAPAGPRWAVVLQGPFCGPIKKKKKVCLILIFSATKQEGKRTLKKIYYFLSNQQIRNPSFFIAIFSHIKSKTRINIQTLGLNNMTLQNQIKSNKPILFNQNSTKTRNYKFDSLNKKNDFHCKRLSSQ